MRAVGVVVALMMLAGCAGSSDGDAPRVLPSTSSSASASTSPSATVAATGKDAPTPQGAAEFAKFFYAEISRGFAERDPNIVSSLSLPTCKTCKLYVDSIRGIRDRNERVTGATFKINFAVAPADTATTAQVDIGWDFPGAVFIDASGKVIDRSPAERNVEEQVELTRLDSSWRVATVKRVKK